MPDEAEKSKIIEQLEAALDLIERLRNKLDGDANSPAQLYRADFWAKKVVRARKRLSREIECLTSRKTWNGGVDDLRNRIESQIGEVKECIDSILERDFVKPIDDLFALVFTLAHPTRRFTHLLDHSTKLYRLNQRKLLAVLKTDLHVGELQEESGGVCAALSCVWIRERMKVSRTLLLGWPPKEQQAVWFRDSDVVSLQRRYIRTVRGCRQDERVQAEFGFWARACEDYGMRMKRPKVENEGNTEFAERMVDLVETQLHDGEALWVGFRVDVKGEKGGAHAIALVLAGNGLYFFDANCGVYIVWQRPEFFVQLENSYLGRGWRIKIDRHFVVRSLVVR